MYPLPPSSYPHPLPSRSPLLPLPSLRPPSPMRQVRAQSDAVVTTRISSLQMKGRHPLLSARPGSGNMSFDWKRVLPPRHKTTACAGEEKTREEQRQEEQLQRLPRAKTDFLSHLSASEPWFWAEKKGRKAGMGAGEEEGKRVGRQGKKDGGRGEGKSKKKSTRSITLPKLHRTRESSKQWNLAIPVSTGGRRMGEEIKSDLQQSSLLVPRCASEGMDGVGVSSFDYDYIEGGDSGTKPESGVIRHHAVEGSKLPRCLSEGCGHLVLEQRRSGGGEGGGIVEEEEGEDEDFFDAMSAFDSRESEGEREWA